MFLFDFSKKIELFFELVMLNRKKESLFIRYYYAIELLYKLKDYWIS